MAPPGPASVARPVSTTASELSAVSAQLIRRLRTAGSFPAHQLTALGRLEREGPLTNSQLAAGEGVRPQSMTQTVADLVGAGLVDRRPDPSDGRQVLLELTEEGRATLARERLARASWLAEAISAELDLAECATLDHAVQLLRRLLAR